MSEKIEKIMQIDVEQYTPEYLEKLSQKCYEDDRNYPENFSNWYPHIKSFGNFKNAKIIANQIFTWEETEKMRETDYIEKVDWQSINEILKPTLEKMQNYKVYSIKNGCFSNKFHFNTCITTKEELVKKLWEINYISTMYDTGGYTELVVRELIYSNENETPTIYNGMPLREELRVFYNLDKKEIEYMVDYWDYDYCYDNLKLTDKIIFDWFHNKTQGRMQSHKLILENMQDKIQKNINTLKFDDKLNGIWSIDFMLENDEIYLIDMARGFRSAYWDENKIRK